VYGTSLDVPNIELGVQLSLIDDGVSIHAFTGKQGKLFWFVIVHTSNDRRERKEKYSTDTAKQICDSLRTKRINSKVTFGDMWDRCSSFQLTPLEEGTFNRWNYGRCVCIGDAVRKVGCVPLSQAPS
jgi:FAD dependent monooxygenase